MMQEKKKLDAVAEKYKAEMMRIYSQKHSDNVQEHNEKQAIDHTLPEKEKIMRPPASAIREAHNADEANEEKAPDNNYPTEEKCKFPPAEEILNMECGSCDEKAAEQEEKAVPASNMRQNHNNMPDTRFDSAESEHMQGNYEFYEENEKCCKDRSDNFDDEDACGTSSARTGTGYIQVEVTDSSSGAPIAGAYAAILKKVWDCEILEAMLITDSNGMTEAIELEVVDSDIDARPYDEYMVTVYKEGFYSVNMLPVPVFDTIRSIQPVEMQKAGEKI